MLTFFRGWTKKMYTGPNFKIGIVQKVYEWSSCPFAKMIILWENHFGKTTAWSLIHFLNYAYLEIWPSVLFFCSSSSFIFQTVIVKLMVNNQVVYSQEGLIIVGIQCLELEIFATFLLLQQYFFFVYLLKLFMDVLFYDICKRLLQSTNP